MGNPLLNPATLVFMGFVLGWHFAAIRLVAGLLTVLVVATLVQNLVKEKRQSPLLLSWTSASRRAVSLPAGVKRCGNFSGAPFRFISWRFWCWRGARLAVPACGWRD
jgi:uncharacterized membrane protein YraQ (UPF0718 family)